MFKAPQRQFGLFTLLNDIIGLTLLVWYALVKPRQLKPITICTGLYNRSDMYLTKLLKSVNRAIHKDLIQLSVFDCASNDIPNLHTSIRSEWQGGLVFNAQPVAFSRSYTFNKAVAQSTNELVFLCDADMSVPENIVELCNQYAAPKRAWFPFVFTLYQNKPAIQHKDNGFWMIHSGKGMLACLKSDYEKIGGLDERFTKWGAEDDDLWERMVRAGFVVIRNKQKGLIHHWHPSFNPNAKTN